MGGGGIQERISEGPIGYNLYLMYIYYYIIYLCYADAIIYGVLEYSTLIIYSNRYSNA